jgi:hypothetical protein
MLIKSHHKQPKKEKPGFCPPNPQFRFQNALPVETNSHDMASKFIFSSFIVSQQGSSCDQLTFGQNT